VDLPARVAGAFDEPFADAAAIPNFLLAESARRHVKVALTGDGGDELFAGYWRHSRAGLENRVRGMLGPAAVVVPALVPKLAPESRRAGLLPLGMPAAQAYAWKHSGLVFDPMLKRGLYSGGFAARCRGFDVSQRFRDYYDRSDAADALGRALYVDFKTSLVDGILVKVDRTSMAHGLEIRSPLLDHHIVEFAARVPSSLKLRSNRGKHLLTQAASDRLPRSVLDRPKHGLTTPVAKWLREDWREMAHDCLLGPTAVARGLFEPRFVESLWTMHLAGRDLYTQHLWTLVMLELWHRRAAASA
jgi:asparagine synthase (glutamine-hydrolysing)